MRVVYLILSYVLAPLVIPILIWKGIGNREYWERWEERFGYGRTRTDKPAIWVHAVSVGEVTAGSSLVRDLQAKYPQFPVVVTTVTPTGAQRLRDIFGDKVIHSYVPYDMPGAVSRFFDRFRPRLAIIMETELWPNLYTECGRRNVPLVLANARISPRSLSRYRRFFSVFKETLSHGIVIAAQSERDAERFLSLGAGPRRTRVVGNIKFDLDIPKSVDRGGVAFRAEQAPGRPVWVAASTHPGEEEKVIVAHRRIQRELPDALLILVPRHPMRFDAIAHLLDKRGMSYVRRSTGAVCGPDTQVFLGDTLGELTMFYAASDIAFVGGSLVPIGGHNLLEPAALSVPIVTGSHNFNAQDISDLLNEAGVASIIGNPRELADEVVALFGDPESRERRGVRGREIVAENRGALTRLLSLVYPLLDQPVERLRPDLLSQSASRSPH